MNKLTGVNLGFAIVLALSSGAAQSGESVTVTSNVSGPGKLEAFLQSTDVTDLGTGCLIGDSGHPCPAYNPYSNGPKNMKFILCLPESGSYQFTDQCKQYTDNQDNCHKNTISGALCGTIGKPYYPQHAQPYCEYRTDSDKAAWNWKVTLNGSVYTVDCSYSGMKPHVPGD